MSLKNDLMYAAFDVLRIIPDEPYLKLLYFLRTKKRLHLNPPVTFNEKQQYLKIHDHSPEYSMMVDKAEAKKYVAKKIGERYVVPMYGVWDRAEDIDFDALPEQFALKCTHDSGSWILCLDKGSFDREAAIKKLNKAAKRRYYYSKREWPYKGLKGRILAEKYLEDTLEDGKPTGKALTDYKIFCFNGQPKVILTVADRPGATMDAQRLAVRHFYDENWNVLPVASLGQEINLSADEKPPQMDEMLMLARKLSEGIPFLRTDFYIVNGQIYFGELTFYHLSGYCEFTPEKYQRIWGDYLDVSGVWQ